jgi:hypothetical protein
MINRKILWTLPSLLKILVAHSHGEPCTGTFGAYAPLPLQRDATPAKPYPFDALGPIAGAAARRIHEVVQAPDATCGQSILAVLSLACQGFVEVHIDGRVHPTSLYLLTISESGERQSAADKVALKSINAWQRMLVEQHKRLLTEHKNKYEVWKARRSVAIREASTSIGDGLTTLEPEPSPPCEGLILCEEPTLEGLEKLLTHGQPSAGIFLDEGGRLVGGHAMNVENLLKTSCGLSNLWDGKPLTRVRKGEESKIHYGRRLSVHLMMQPVVLMLLLNNKLLMEQGLLSRCLFSSPLPLSGTRKYKEIDLNKDAAIVAFYDLIDKVLDRPYPRASSERTSSESEGNKPFGPGDALQPKPVELEKGAKKRWIEFHDETERKMNEDGEFYPIKPFASKAPEQVLRIATIFAFSESVLRPEIEVTIDLQQLERAITLVLYHLDEALRILGKNAGDPNINLAAQTLEWIKRNRSNQIFPIADIYQRGPPQIRNAEKAKNIMRILREHGLVTEIQDVVIDGRRMRSAWSLVNDGDDKK